MVGIMFAMMHSYVDCTFFLDTTLAYLGFSIGKRLAVICTPIKLNPRCTISGLL